MTAGRAQRLPARIADWFYGFKPPERGLIHLGHRRVYIVPSRLGWIYAASLLVMLIGSINFALSLGFALTFMLAGMGLACMVHTFRNLARLTVSTGRSDPVFAGESARFRLYLESGVRFDRHSILVRHVEFGAQLVIVVPAGNLTEVPLAIPVETRGLLPLGRVMLETRFPLGLFRAWSYVEPDSQCLVYPRPEFLPLPPSSGSASDGQLQTLAPGNDDYAGLRSHQPSDSPRHVAWKTLARSGEMYTKQFTGDSAARLWLEWSRVPGSDGVEQRLSRLTGWVLGAEQAGLHYGLRLPGREIAPGSGDTHRTACLEALAMHGRPPAAT